MTAPASSWIREPFGEVTPLAYARTFDDADFQRLKEGLAPEEMEDRWLIYYDEPCLYFHRSWTGQPVYRLTLQRSGNGAQTTEACWAKELATAEYADAAYQVQLLDFLVSNLLLGQAKPFPLPENLRDKTPGLYQHHVAGTGYPETAPTPRPWWRFW